MRWRFVYKESDIRRKESIQSLIDGWWNSFRSSKSSFTRIFEQKPDSPIIPPDVSRLKAINEHLMWECSSPSEGNFHLVITCEDHIELRSLVSEIIQRAPRLENWTFDQYRQAELPSLVEASYEAKFKETIPKDLTVTFERTPGNQINLRFQSAKFNGENNAEDIAECMIVSSTAFGEEALEKWIGYVLTSESFQGWKKVLTLFSGSSTSSRLGKYERWQNEFKKIRSEICASRPSQFVSELLDPVDIKWTVLSIKPEKMRPEDPPPERLTWITQHPDVILGTLNNLQFCSENFSAVSELFCFLKSDRTDGQTSLDVEQDSREVFFDALNKELRDQIVGCAFATGIGPVNRFWDMCLTDVEKAVPILKKLVTLHGLKGAQLYFYDESLRDETIDLS